MDPNRSPIFFEASSNSPSARRVDGGSSRSPVGLRSAEDLEILLGENPFTIQSQRAQSTPVALTNNNNLDLLNLVSLNYLTDHPDLDTRGPDSNNLNLEALTHSTSNSQNTDRLSESSVVFNYEKSRYQPPLHGTNSTINTLQGIYPTSILGNSEVVGYSASGKGVAHHFYSLPINLELNDRAACLRDSRKRDAETEVPVARFQRTEPLKRDSIS